MKITIGDYQIEKIDEGNIRLSKVFVNKKGKLVYSIIGYYAPSKLYQALESLNYILAEKGEEIKDVQTYIKQLKYMKDYILEEFKRECKGINL